MLSGRAIVIGVVAILAVGGGGGYFAYAHMQQKERASIAQSLADLSQCLTGQVITADGDVVVAVSSLEGRLAHRPPALRTRTDGSAWPASCGAHAKAMYDVVHASSSFDRDAKGTLLAELEAVEKATASEDPAGAALPGKTASLWRAMQEKGVAMAQTSSVPTPPILRKSDVNGDLPIAQLLPLEGGPDTQFLIELPAKEGSGNDASPDGRVGLCTWAGGKATCKKLPGTAVYTPIGTWSSSSFVPLSVDGELGVFDGKEISKLGIGAPVSGNVHVDEKGTTFALDCSLRGACDPEAGALLVKPSGGPAKKRDLIDVLGPVKDEVQSRDVSLVGTMLYFEGRSAVRVPLDAAGKVSAGSAHKTGLSWASAPRRACAAGKTMVLTAEIGPAFATSEGVVGTRGASLLRCYPDGSASTTDLEICRADGCKMAVTEDMRKRLPNNAVVGRVGNRTAILWSASGAKGVLLQMVGDDPSKLEPEIVLAEKSVDKQYLAIVGVPEGALVFWEHDKRPRGVFVAPDGKVSPIPLETW